MCWKSAGNREGDQAKRHGGQPKLQVGKPYLKSSAMASSYIVGNGLVSFIFISSDCAAPIGPCDNRPMPSRARTKRPRDTNQLAWQIVQEATGQAPPQPPEPPDTRNPAAVALSKLGASKGGKARAAKLSPAKRSAIARKAVLARWRRKT